MRGPSGKPDGPCLEALFHQTGFLVVFHGAGMDGRAHALKHLLLGQVGVGFVKFLEIVQILEDLLGHGVDHVVRDVLGGAEGGLDREGGHVFLVLGHLVEG